MKTTTQESKDRVRQHILERVTHPETGEKFSTIREAAECLWNDFEQVCSFRFSKEDERELFYEYMAGTIFDFSYWHEHVKANVVFFGGLDNDKCSCEEYWRHYCFLIHREMSDILMGEEN